MRSGGGLAAVNLVVPDGLLIPNIVATDAHAFTGPGTPVPLALTLDALTADIRIGYARRSMLPQELQSQLGALAKHSIRVTTRCSPRRSEPSYVSARTRSTPSKTAAEVRFVAHGNGAAAGGS
ncbi:MULTISPECIES: hypothetical protein [Streptomyces]|uniref:Uncharacterized protein n=2 Tax=Streptomyces TaxID=1883 RepID=A0A2N8P8H0_STRNR|nr:MULTISPECIES: hypothetical protein [Streptomyces]PNE37323.1 hypothetical protein AOB60_23585 [Streptomyces noursei]SHM24626.1 hypothetical protein SAMN05216268_109239 [Streptomyces yunnanensis]